LAYGWLSEYLRKLRLDCELSYRDAAEKAGISAAYLLLIEKGKRGIPGADILKNWPWSMASR
jgi:transcriptional regulator with XRE-family HTH domain